MPLSASASSLPPSQNRVELCSATRHDTTRRPPLSPDPQDIRHPTTSPPPERPSLRYAATKASGARTCSSALHLRRTAVRPLSLSLSFERIRLALHRRAKRGDLHDTRTEAPGNTNNTVARGAVSTTTQPAPANAVCRHHSRRPATIYISQLYQKLLLPMQVRRLLLCPRLGSILRTS